MRPQVELAQTEYQLPRLTRMWTHLDRVTGGGQVKGTGEKQIDIDRRLLRDKASALRKELEAVRTHRRNYRTRRSLAPIPVVALVGYTNAGARSYAGRHSLVPCAWRWQHLAHAPSLLPPPPQPTPSDACSRACAQARARC